MKRTKRNTINKFLFLLSNHDIVKTMDVVLKHNCIIWNHFTRTGLFAYVFIIVSLILSGILIQNTFLPVLHNVGSIFHKNIPVYRHGQNEINKFIRNALHLNILPIWLFFMFPVKIASTSSCPDRSCFSTHVTNWYLEMRLDKRMWLRFINGEFNREI